MLLAGERAQLLWTLTLLPGDMSSIPSPNRVIYSFLQLHFQGIWWSALASTGTRHKWFTCKSASKAVIDPWNKKKEKLEQGEATNFNWFSSEDKWLHKAQNASFEIWSFHFHFPNILSTELANYFIGFSLKTVIRKCSNAVQFLYFPVIRSAKSFRIYIFYIVYLLFLQLSIQFVRYLVSYWFRHYSTL